ncbi:hypothetical protein HPB47_013190 [Ixodes persulcatus]|uniref:Uncharacterized protein n=1 Tax=Ixodes persulcatus TaxID=34615 RepID=A0AC60QZ41_IXOPE|nr:hypothetical protein HPB47_013190 [Ixodes persulcatus]
MADAVHSTSTLKQGRHPRPPHTLEAGANPASRRCRNLGTKLPRQVSFRHAVLLCYLCREKIETCFNGRQTGHRVDVCRQATSNKCRNCGTEHSNTNPDGSTYTCKPVCIICGEKHETVFKVCPYRFAQREKTPAPSTPSDRKSRRRSRLRQGETESLRSRGPLQVLNSAPRGEGQDKSATAVTRPPTQAELS